MKIDQKLKLLKYSQVIHHSILFLMVIQKNNAFDVNNADTRCHEPKASLCFITTFLQKVLINQ